MRHLLCLSAVLFGTLPIAAASERWQTLQAINWVENPTNHHNFGSKGELGPYQFRRMTWNMHTSAPFHQAVDRATADGVAVKHYEWIKKGLSKAGVDPSPFNIAMAWNCGLSAVINGRVPTVTYRYAEQVSNLVETFQHRQRLASNSSGGKDDSGFKWRDRSSQRFAIVLDAPRFSVVGEESRYLLLE